MLSPVSTWMGDRLGTLGAVGIFFVFDPTTILHDMKEEVDGMHRFRMVQYSIYTVVRFTMILCIT